MTARSAPFTIANAFTSNPFGGNPAAIIFLDTNAPLEILQGISKNFNQPMAVFVTPVEPPKPGETVIHTDIRFILVTGVEVPLCGHGSLAAAKAILALPGIVGHDVGEIRFRTVHDLIITIQVVEGGLLQMELPVAEMLPVSPEEHLRIKAILDRGFGRDVRLKEVLYGGEKFELVMMMVLDEDENLAESTLDNTVFGETGRGVNIVTTVNTRNTELGEKFVSRMFSVHVPGGEDHVCGSAHCLLVPYWYEKLGLKHGEEVVAKQVSLRGGLLNVILDVGTPTIKLRGEATVFSTGTCYF